MKYLIILILPIIISCNINSGNIDEDNLRKYNISDEFLARGLVKKFIFKSPKDTTFIYDKIIRQNDTIISKRYNDKFLLVRDDINKINKNEWTLISRAQIGTDRKRYNQEMVIPYKTSFNPNDRILESLIQSAPIEGYIFKNYEKRTLLNKSVQNYKGKQINCIRYNSEMIYTVHEISTSKVVKEIIKNGYSLFGEEIGWFYFEWKENNETQSLELLEIMTIDKFEKNKL